MKGVACMLVFKQVHDMVEKVLGRLETWWRKHWASIGGEHSGRKG
jgi:hypothetical protein